MQEGQTSPRADELSNQLRQGVDGFEPGTDAQRAVYSQELERVHDFDQAREARLLDARKGIPPTLWIILVIQGADTTTFTYFVGMKSTGLHVLAVAALTAGIALILFAIGVLEHPFGTTHRVSPDTFELVLRTIEAGAR